MSTLSPERLGLLPTKLIEDLRIAALDGEKRIIDGLILRVHVAGHPEPAHALQDLADGYDYASMADYLGAVCRRNRQRISCGTS